MFTDWAIFFVSFGLYCRLVDYFISIRYMTADSGAQWSDGPSTHSPYANFDNDMNVGGNAAVDEERHVDSMVVASMNVNEDSWIQRMQVNNEPLNYDFPAADDNDADSDEAEMEVPLDDDLCTAQMLARSVVANLQFSSERFSTSCVQAGFSVGMVFETKDKFLQQLTEWSILHAVSYKPIKSNKTQYTAICTVEGNCPWRIHAIVSKKSKSGWWKIRNYPSEHTCVNLIVNSNHKQATSKFLVTKIMSFVKADLDISAGTVQVLVHDQLFINISYMSVASIKQRNRENLW